MKRLFLFTWLFSVASISAQEKSVTLKIWPGAVPGENAPIEAEKFLEPKADEKPPTKRVTNVSQPTITVYPAPAGKNTGVAVLIAPGGGYNILAWDKEGEEVAAWLNKIGITGVLLKYRVPRRPDTAKDKSPLGPQQDAQRALSLVRSKAKEWGLDPNKIGMLGFSAGGHLTAMTALNHARRSYPAADAIDQVSARPDFAVLIYSGGLIDKATNQLHSDVVVPKDAPPCFFAHAVDDPVVPENSIQLFLALKREKIPAELHVYSSGGHGFGLRPSEHPVSTWPDRCEAWLKRSGFIK